MRRESGLRETKREGGRSRENKRREEDKGKEVPDQEPNKFEFSSR